MPKTYTVHLHYQDDSHSVKEVVFSRQLLRDTPYLPKPTGVDFSDEELAVKEEWEVSTREEDNEDYKHFLQAKVPDHTRESTIEAVKFAYVQSFLQHRILNIKEFPTTAEQIAILKYIEEFSLIARWSDEFKDEVLKIMFSALLEAENFGKEFVAMQEKNFLPYPFNQKTDMPVKQVIKIKEALEKLKAKINPLPYHRNLEALKSWNREPGFKTYFDKLKFDCSKPNKSHDSLLSENYAANKNEDLLHVRMCEDLGCDLNSNVSDFVKYINENVCTQVIEYIKNKFPNPKSKIIYAGFASGFLLRDLQIIKELIALGYHHWEFMFVDRAYEKFIKQMTVDLPDADCESHVELMLINNAIKEFASWVATHVNNDTVSFHLFSNVTDALQFLNANNKKIDLLVGQDYFTEFGCLLDSKYATPSAHKEFMQLATNGSAEGAHFFEAIKNQAKKGAATEIFLHVGFIYNGKYYPKYTNTYDGTTHITKVHNKTSLSFFTRCPDDKPQFCTKGAQWVRYQDQQLLNGTEPMYSYLKSKNNKA